MDTELQGKVVLVTGAAGGIGSELVREFHKAGAAVAIHYHSNRQGATSLAQELGVGVEHLYQADLCKENEVSRLFDEIERNLGAPQVLVANAGCYVERDVPIHRMSLSQWESTLSSNLTSVFLSVREFLKVIERVGLQDPSIVFIGSTAGILGEAYHADYAASKSAVIYGLMRSLKNELPKISKMGRVNAVCPSWTLTAMAQGFAEHPEAVTRHLQTVALQKLARPGDVAKSVLFLASPRLSGHMTGQILELSGGLEGRVIYSSDEIDLSQA